MIDFFCYFVKDTKSIDDASVLLVIIQMRNIFMLSTNPESIMSQLYACPPQSTAKMQPLDMPFMAPFKIRCQAVKTYLKNSVGRVVGLIADKVIGFFN
jgi:hypothetical protein